MNTFFFIKLVIFKFAQYNETSGKNKVWIYYILMFYFIYIQYYPQRTVNR